MNFLLMTNKTFYQGVSRGHQEERKDRELSILQKQPGIAKPRTGLLQ